MGGVVSRESWVVREARGERREAKGQDGRTPGRHDGRTPGRLDAWRMLVIALVVAGCGKAERAEKEKVEGRAALPVAAAVPSAALTGTVVYRERIMLPPSAMLTVRLTDVSKQDVAGMVLAEQVISPVTVPAAYSLAYDPAQIDSVHTYVIQARIEDGGKLRFINMEQFQVLTRGAPRDSVEVLVKGVK